jgi:hypothetical protein
MWCVSRYGWIIALTGKAMNPTGLYKRTSKRHVKSFSTKKNILFCTSNIVNKFLERTLLVFLLREKLRQKSGKLLHLGIRIHEMYSIIEI